MNVELFIYYIIHKNEISHVSSQASIEFQPKENYIALHCFFILNFLKSSSHCQYYLQRHKHELIQ